MASTTPVKPEEVRTALDQYGLLVQYLVLGTVLSLAILRRVQPSKKVISGINPNLTAFTAGGLFIFPALSYIPFQINPSLLQNYIYFTRLPVQLLASLLPLQVLLSHSSPLNPLTYLLSTSRIKLLSWHKTLGWSFMILLATHGTMYINFYLEKGILLKRMGMSNVQLGLALSTVFSTVAYASRKSFRVEMGKTWVWWHIGAVVLILGLLWFHAGQARVYVLEAGVVTAVGIGYRVVKVLG